MTDKDKALSLEQTLRLALEALKEITLEHGMTEKARTAIKAALEAKDEETELEKDAVNLLFALHDAWPYVHRHCTIESNKKSIQALIVKHGDFADLHPHPPQQEAKYEPVAWDGYNLDDMCEAFNRVIEEHFHRKHPFHDPVNNDAMIALRTLRGFIPYMKRHTTPPPVAEPHKRKPLTEEKFKHMPELFVVPPHHVEMVVRAIEAAHGIIDPTDLKGKHDA